MIITARWKFYIIFALIIITVSRQINAQGSEDCHIQADIYLFEYADPLWTEYTQLTRDIACDLHYFWSHSAPIDIYDVHPSIVQEYSDSFLTTPPNYERRSQNGACLDLPSSDTVSAYYCRNPNGIVIREPTQFVNYLAWEQSDLGALKIALSLAHEYGHHVQLPPVTNLKNRELQAECYVGAYFQFAIENQDLTIVDFTLDDWSAIQRTIPIDVSQDIMVGTSGIWSTITLLERGNALRLGYNHGILECFDMFDE